MALLYCLLLAAASAGRAHDKPAEPPLEAARDLGVVKTEAGWRYRGQTLTATETEKVARFLLGLPADGREAALMAPLLEALGKEGRKPEEVSWFEKGLPLKLSAAGRDAIPAVLLGRTAEVPKIVLSPPAPKSWFLDNEALTKLAAASLSFDGARPPSPVGTARPLVLDIRWGTPPRSEVWARNTNTVFGAYGRGADELLHLAFKDPRSKGAVAARIAKIPVDGFLAYVDTIFNHEAGHFENHYMAGADHVSWIPADGPYALGHIVQADYPAGLPTPQGHLAVTAGGVQATQAAAGEMRRLMLSGEKVDWTTLAQFVSHKQDITIYGLYPPMPSRAGAKFDANDMIKYSRLYGARAGVNPDSVEKAIIGGAVWNALDPLNFWGLYSYFVGYVARGEERFPTPMVKLGGAEAMVGTGFWLSEVGPQYTASVLLRKAGGGPLLEVSPSVGDGGQFGVGARVEGLKIAEGLEGEAGGQVWLQRAHAEPGPKQVGGAVQSGLRFGWIPKFSLSVDAGYKVLGAMLGEPFAAGPFVMTGASATY